MPVPTPEQTSKGEGSAGSRTAFGASRNCAQHGCTWSVQTGAVSQSGWEPVTRSRGRESSVLLPPGALFTQEPEKDRGEQQGQQDGRCHKVHQGHGNHHAIWR